MSEKIIIELPNQTLTEMDKIVKQIGFKKREEFIKAAVNRAVDNYKLIMKNL